MPPLRLRSRFAVAVRRTDRTQRLLRADRWTLQRQAIFAMTSSRPPPGPLHRVGGAVLPSVDEPFDAGDFVSSLPAGETNRRAS